MHLEAFMFCCSHIVFTLSYFRFYFNCKSLREIKWATCPRTAMANPCRPEHPILMAINALVVDRWFPKSCCRWSGVEWWWRWRWRWRWRMRPVLSSFVSCWPAGSGFECISYMIIMLVAASCNSPLQHALHLQFLAIRPYPMVYGRWSMGLSRKGLLWLVVVWFMATSCPIYYHFHLVA